MRLTPKEFLPGFVVISLIGIFAMVIVMLLLKPMPLSEAAGTLLVALIGMLSTKISTIVDFYFGSNKASKDKDATILAQAQNGATIEAPPAPIVSGRPTLTAVPPAPGA
jgi:hypothetical protein